jgi:hypothetical protein
LAVEMMRCVESIVEGIKEPPLPKPIIGPGVPEVLRHVHPDMFAQLCPPAYDGEDPKPRNDVVPSELGPSVGKMNSRKDDDPVNELRGIAAAVHPEFGEERIDIFVLEPSRPREPQNKPCLARCRHRGIRNEPVVDEPDHVRVADGIAEILVVLDMQSAEYLEK